jgi:hypothetical protein
MGKIKDLIKSAIPASKMTYNRQPDVIDGID